MARAMFALLRQFVWRLRYRPGRIVTFCYAYDGFTEVLIVENRVALTGTLLYRERGVNVLGTDQPQFGPLSEDTVPEMIRRARKM